MSTRVAVDYYLVPRGGGVVRHFQYAAEPGAKHGTVAETEVLTYQQFQDCMWLHFRDNRQLEIVFRDFNHHLYAFARAWANTNVAYDELWRWSDSQASEGYDGIPTT